MKEIVKMYSDNSLCEIGSDQTQCFLTEPEGAFSKS